MFWALTLTDFYHTSVRQFEFDYLNGFLSKTTTLISASCSDLVHLFVFYTLPLLVVYFAVGLRSSAAAVFTYLLIMFIVANTGVQVSSSACAS